MLLTTLGRHFALAEKTLLVVGRDERENNRIAELAASADMELELVSIPGPLSLLRGPASPEIIRIAAAITAFCSKARNEKQVEVTYRKAREFRRGSDQGGSSHRRHAGILQDCLIGNK